jgi:hypothetical protein
LAGAVSAGFGQGCRKLETREQKGRKERKGEERFLTFVRNDGRNRAGPKSRTGGSACAGTPVLYFCEVKLEPD